MAGGSAIKLLTGSGEAVVATPADEPPAKAVELVEEPDDPLDRIDEWILAGCHDKAISLCRASLAAGESEAVFRYRQALAFEASGQIHDALRRYTGMEDSEDVRIGLLSQFGQMRCLIRTRQYAEAWHIIDRLRVLSGHPALQRLNVRSDLQYWSAVCQLREMNDRANLSPFSIRAVWSAEFRLPVELYLQWAKPHVPERRVANHSIAVEPVARTASWQHVRTAILLALAADSKHPFALAARLEIANLDFREGRMIDAERQYEELLANEIDPAMLRLAEYNLALLRLNTGARPHARDLLINVIDRAPNDEMAGFAWWFMARSHLDVGDAEKALKPLRAAASSSSERVRGAAAVGLCAAHLLLDADGEAVAALRNAPKGVVRRPPFRDDASTFEFWVRYRTAQAGGSRAIAERNDLINALQLPPSKSVLGPAGVWLRAAAFRTAGLEWHMATYLETALPSIRGPFANRMVTLLVEYSLRLGQHGRAQTWLLAIEASSEDDGTGAWAGLRLAEIALQQRRIGESIARCRALLDNPAAKREAVLNLLGLSYEAKGDYRSAAECFAGRVPGP